MIKRNYTEEIAFENVKRRYPNAKNDHRKVIQPILKHLLYYTKTGFRRKQIEQLPDFWSFSDAKKIGGKSFCQSILISMSDGTASVLPSKNHGIQYRTIQEFYRDNDYNILSDGYFFENDVLSEDFAMHIIEIENTAPITERRKIAYTNALDGCDILEDVDVYFHLFDKSGMRERIYKTTPTHSMMCYISGNNLFDCQYDLLTDYEKSVCNQMGLAPAA